MKKNMINNGLAFTLGLLVPQVLRAQGATYLSNLEQPSVGGLAVGSDSWAAAIFVVGGNTSGYVLNSVELAMNNSVDNPSALQVMIYSSSGGGYAPPKTYVGTLSGSLDPVTPGVYTFSPDVPITFLPNGGYAIVLTSGTAVANGAYEWSYGNANSYNPVGGWYTLQGGLAGAWTSGDASPNSWNLDRTAFPQFAIEATAVPEPGVLSLFVLVGVHLVWRRKIKAV